MELIKALQNSGSFFVGGAPKELEAYLKGFALSIGVSATTFASNSRRGVVRPSTRGPKSLTELGKIGALFTGRYCNNDQNVVWTSESIAPIMESQLDDSDDNDISDDKSSPSKASSAKKSAAAVKQSASGALLKRPKRNRASMPTLDFLEDLANALNTETMELSMDYLVMHRSCWRLLRLVNDDCKPKLLEIYGPGYLEKEYSLPYVVGYIFMTATRTSQLANVLLPRRGDVQVSSHLLKTAADCLMGMIASGAGEFAIQRMKTIYGHDIDMDGFDDILT